MIDIDWKEIKEKYSNALEKYCKYFNIYYYEDFDTCFYEESEFKHNDGSCLILPVRKCYCDIEKFFDDNGVIITIDSAYMKQYWFVIETDQKIYNHEVDCYSSRQEAKEQAIKKAFEILEEQLKAR
jgi:hypothetical protein